MLRSLRAREDCHHQTPMPTARVVSVPQACTHGGQSLDLSVPKNTQLSVNLVPSELPIDRGPCAPRQGQRLYTA